MKLTFVELTEDEWSLLRSILRDVYLEWEFPNAEIWSQAERDAMTRLRDKFALTRPAAKRKARKKP